MSTRVKNKARPNYRRELGVAGENLAAQILSKSDYRVVDRNWRCRYGEVDIVALSPEGLLVFVEVKTRSSNRCGTPAEAITKTKLSRMRRVAGQWLRSHKEPHHQGIRLDLVCVVWDGNATPLWEHRRGVQ